ncbi:hypothetical protein Dda_4447 [Drechslerella dactyloides]|uniref:Uncharacterized protein n=1 Tax=Drechslerella dactyloides TaxID=74499 RepID=A0AAD6IWX1_DREDA|nr:hypothetical protein Dda_4447 [Drechslerella dactyloides]
MALDRCCPGGGGALPFGETTGGPGVVSSALQSGAGQSQEVVLQMRYLRERRWRKENRRLEVCYKNSRDGSWGLKFKPVFSSPALLVGPLEVAIAGGLGLEPVCPVRMVGWNLTIGRTGWPLNESCGTV